MKHNSSQLLSILGAILVFSIGVIGNVSTVEAYFYADKIQFSANLYTTGSITYYTGAVATNIRSIT
jgi:hypothetical protein